MTETTSKTNSKTLKISKDSSKAEEIAYIENLASQIPDGTYLKDFFTKELVAWVSEQISNDFCPDLMGTLQSEWNGSSKRTMEYQKDLSQAQTEIKVLNETISQMAEEMARLSDKSQSLQTRLSDATEAYNKAWNTACDATREASDRDNEARTLEAKIKELKIRIYDLEHGEA